MTNRITKQVLDASNSCNVAHNADSQFRFHENTDYLRHWNRRLIALYFGRNDPAENGGLEGISGGQNGKTNKYHIITHAPRLRDYTQTDHDRRLLVSFRYWNYVYELPGSSRKFEWFKDFADSTADWTKTVAYHNPASNDADTDYPSGGGDAFVCDYTPQLHTAKDGFRCSKFQIDNALVHSLSVEELPLKNSQLSNSQKAWLDPSRFKAGQPLTAQTGTPYTGSIDSLINVQNGYGTDSCIANQARCLFQTPYPVCAYSDGDGTSTMSWRSLREDGHGHAQKYKL